MKELSLPTRYYTGFFNGDIVWSMGKTTSSERTVDMYELEMTTENGTVTYIDGVAYPAVKNTVFITVPGMIRHTDLPFICMYVKFHATGMIKDIITSLPTSFTPINTSEVAELFKKTIQSNENNDNIFATGSHFMSLLLKLTKENELNKNISANNINYSAVKMISDAKKFMQQNYQLKLSLKDIADSVNLSQSYFHSLFKRTEGITPHEYLLKKRIESAKTVLLCNDGLSMSEIAEKCGFESQVYFNYVFKRETLLTPMQYRKLAAQKYLE